MLRNLGKLEKSVYRTYWNDGLIDLLAAIGVLAVGLLWVWERPVFAAIVPPLLVPLWGPCRRRLIEPRLGMIEFSDDRDRRSRQSLRLVFFLGVGCLVMAVGMYLARDALAVGRDIDFIAGLPAFLLAIMAALTGLLIASTRFMAYALVLVLAGVTGAYAAWSPGQIIVAAGLVMLFSSVVILTRFFRSNPEMAGSTE